MKLWFVADSKKDETPDLFYNDTNRGLEQLGVDLVFLADINRIANIFFNGNADDAADSIKSLTEQGLIDRVNELLACSELVVKSINVDNIGK